jgi:hypothetical protein
MPDARLALRIDIREQPHDPPPAHGPRWKGVDMQARVVVNDGRRPSFDFDRTVARGRTLEFPGIGRQKLFHEPRRRLREPIHHLGGNAGDIAGRRGATQLA